MELRFARAARTTKDFDLGLRGNRAEPAEVTRG